MTRQRCGGCLCVLAAAAWLGQTHWAPHSAVVWGAGSSGWANALTKTSGSNTNHTEQGKRGRLGPDSQTLGHCSAATKRRAVLSLTTSSMDQATAHKGQFFRGALTKSYSKKLPSCLALLLDVTSYALSIRVQLPFKALGRQGGSLRTTTNCRRQLQRLRVHQARAPHHGAPAAQSDRGPRLRHHSARSTPGGSARPLVGAHPPRRPSRRKSTPAASWMAHPRSRSKRKATSAAAISAALRVRPQPAPTSSPSRRATR